MSETFLSGILGPRKTPKRIDIGLKSVPLGQVRVIPPSELRERLLGRLKREEKMKIGFLREHAIAVLSENDVETDYTIMNNTELGDEMCVSGFIHDEHMAGVFDNLPPDVWNGHKLAQEQGWPPSPPEKS